MVESETIETAQAVCKRAQAVNWNDLLYFLAIVRAGTLVGAGRELGVEHTTVARRLAALETALGTKLFLRGPEGFTLTDAGREILPSAEAIARHIEEIAHKISGLDARVEGTVRLTTSEAIERYMVEALSRLRERHPALLVEILTDNRALDIRRGEADLAVRFVDVDDVELIVRKLGIAGWSLYASERYIERKGLLESPDNLTGHDLIGYAPNLAKAAGARWLEAHASGAHFALRANSISAAVDAALVGFGLVALPCFVAHEEHRLKRLTPKVVGARDILLVVHPELARVARVRATMDFLVELFTRDAAIFAGEPV
jgi:DNA-binding transcriptional LysR family regulator